ncbi:MAG: hypothetical protein EA402_02665 [Planctomycetota bacterium]|nr:MAG: hypothetical protein EA402_02665 [Planctomycetota bacterium]
MPFPRPAARPWQGFGLSSADGPLLPLPLLRLAQQAHAAERAAAIAYRGHRCCFRGRVQRQQIHHIALEEWRHRAWLRRRLLPALGVAPRPLMEAAYLLLGMAIALTCLLIGPFWATYFAGRLEHGNGAEYDRLAAGLLAHPQLARRFHQPLRHMARVERRHERSFFGLLRHHPLLPPAAGLFGWPRRRWAIDTLAPPSAAVGGQAFPQWGLLPVSAYLQRR